MLQGLLYDASDPELAAARRRARRLLQQFNTAPADDHASRDRILSELLGSRSRRCFIEPNFRCDYGSNIHVGDGFFANFDCVILDCATVTIGHDVSFAPGVHLYAAYHPIDAAERVKGPEYAGPITIGSRVWIGGGAIILANVTIGDDTVIGAGSVVTTSIPAGVVAAGSPCRVVGPSAGRA
jgi:maltose O-acetyltransferase